MMGKLPESAIEIKLAVTLFLLLLGLADLFGAWQVKNFSAFTPRGVADSLVRQDQPHHDDQMEMEGSEEPIDVESLNKPAHRLDRDLLVQDTHVHIPAYAMTAAFLAIIVFGLRLSSRLRVFLVVLSFAAPFADFAGLWGAYVFPRFAIGFSTLAIVGGFSMGVAYLIVLWLTVTQCWILRTEKSHE